MGEALTSMDAIANQILKPGYAVDYNGQSREFRQSSSSLAFTFTLALAFIYLVLAAQFESFRDPFIIMLTVPLSMAGALLALWLAGGTLNVYSQIGLVTLVGLITKHGILIVEFANQLQEKGIERTEAVIESATLRLRPILMTTGAMVLGTVPLALATGAGAESRQQIGWVIVGGLLLGTFFTLFVVPTVYSLLAASGLAYGAGQRRLASPPARPLLLAGRRGKAQSLHPVAGFCRFRHAAVDRLGTLSARRRHLADSDQARLPDALCLLRLSAGRGAAFSPARAERGG
jgi:hypothetical protein